MPAVTLRAATSASALLATASSPVARTAKVSAQVGEAGPGAMGYLHPAIHSSPPCLMTSRAERHQLRRAKPPAQLPIQEQEMTLVGTKPASLYPQAVHHTPLSLKWLGETSGRGRKPGSQHSHCPWCQPQTPCH